MWSFLLIFQTLKVSISARNNWCFFDWILYKKWVLSQCDTPSIISKIKCKLWSAALSFFAPKNKLHFWYPIEQNRHEVKCSESSQFLSHFGDLRVEKGALCSTRICEQQKAALKCRIFFKAWQWHLKLSHYRL